VDEQRKHGRAKSPVAIELSHDDLGTIWVSSRDISEGGVFVSLGADQVSPPVGTVLNLKISGFMSGEKPELLAKVVRIEADGIALQFLQDLFLNGVT
jgi:hypothetical protein